MDNFLDIVDRRSLGFRDFEGLKDCTFYPSENSEISLPSNSLKGEELFNIIFSVDPVTGLPQGDLAVFMSENTSPEVKQYITQNLMLDVSSSAAPSVMAKDSSSLDDDMINQLSRGSFESLSDYRDRMINFVKSQRDDLQKMNNNEST